MVGGSRDPVSGAPAWPGQGGYGAYGGYGGHPVAAPTARTASGRYLIVAVAVLGLAVYGVGFGPVGEHVSAGWPVRFSVLAAIVAALSFLPRRAPHAWIVVAFAAVGFLEALASWIRAEHAGWAIVVIVALTGVQTIAAVVATATQSNSAETQVDAAAATYAAYPYYAAYQSYAAQQYQQRPREASAQGQARGAASADGSAGQSYEEMRARYAQSARQPDGAAPRASAPSSAGVSAPGAAGFAAVSPDAVTAQRPEPRPSPGETASP